MATKAFKEIIKLGHPTLRKVAVPFNTTEMVAPTAQKLVKRMKDVLRATDSGIGLAAPQIDVQRQLVVVEVRPLDTFGGKLKGIEPTPFFNPVLELQGEEDVLMLESCLSVPDLCGFVSRRKRLTMYYWSDQAKPMKLKAIGYWSGLIQVHNPPFFPAFFFLISISILYVDQMLIPLAFLA
jgi:peptide deformylase